MHWFGVKRTVKLSIKSLWMHRLRSLLTMLGIIFGVCSVIAMLAIGEGASREAQRAIAELGSTNLIVETVEPPKDKVDTGEAQLLVSYGLTYADAESIHNTFPDVEVAVPVREIDQQASYQSRSTAVKIIGTIPWYTEISPINLLRGRFLSSIDIHHQLAVCVIDDMVARRLFPLSDPVGLYVRIQGNYYKVVGITAPSATNEKLSGFTAKSHSAAGSQTAVTGNVYIPLSTVKSRFGEINFSFSGGSGSAEKVELQKITVKVASSEQVLPMHTVLGKLLDRLHDKQDYRIIVPLELLRQAAKTKRIFSIVLGSIAAISLLVGGIGIMNIMLATVSERTREIGIRRAVGAKKRDIIVQFLSETLVLTLIGGVLGIILGSVIPFMVTIFGNMPTVITAGSLVLAFGVSAIIGVSFGLYPAYRAANMDPIESLRHE